MLKSKKPRPLTVADLKSAIASEDRFYAYLSDLCGVQFDTVLRSPEEEQSEALRDLNRAAIAATQSLEVISRLSLELELKQIELGVWPCATAAALR